MVSLNIGAKYNLEGELLAVLKYPAPVLKKVALNVSDFDNDLATTVKNMLFTMYKAPGIGLAAPQIGQSIRMFVMDTNFERERITSPDGSDSFKYSNFSPMVFINPEIIEKQGEIIWQEGCLSFPGIFEDVKRAETIVVKYKNLNGEDCTYKASEVEAICIQHELDHLDGIVFLERLSPLKKALLLKKFSKKKKKGSF